MLDPLAAENAEVVEVIQIVETVKTLLASTEFLSAKTRQADHTGPKKKHGGRFRDGIRNNTDSHIIVVVIVVCARIVKKKN